MRRVEMIINGSGTTAKGLASAELNHHIRYDEEKETRGNGVDGEGQMLSDEDESRINEDVENMDLVIHKPQQQKPLVPVVRWERFLHVRSLKVLLVEDDDSTRHVVSALLRNCSYEVTAVANGLQAWKILEDVTNHIDLVLTEVVMPFLSGLGLLFKIMSHQARKNIPVIMMSSHDSMGIVFKCLSKGAVDFLVKPIRKNELKNLWQHVWRKCHSSSCSGSESGVRTQISAKMISAEESDKAGSNDEDDNRSISLNTRDGSDHGSGTQSSWTKWAGEVDSPQPMPQCDQLADDPPDSTCAQVNYSRAEALCNYRESMTATREHQRQDDELDNAAMGKHLTIGVPKSPNLPVEGLNDKILNNTADNHEHKFSEICSKKDDGQFEKGQVELNSEKPNDKLRNQAVVLLDFIANSSDPQMETSTFEIPNITESNDMTIYDTKEMFSLELCLKSLRNIEDNGTSAHNRNILRHSNLSAFSRYNSASTASPASTGNVGSYLPLDNSSETMQNLKSNLDGTPPNQHPNGSSNNNDMGSTTNNAFTKPVEFNDNSAPKITVKLVNSSSTFQPVQNVQTSSLQPNTVLAQAGEMQQQVQVHHRHHHYHHHHHHVHKLPQQEQQLSHDDLSLNKMAVASPQCGSSNVWRVPINVNASNHSLNGSASASGSNHGSNGQNGSSIVVNNGVTIMEGDNDIAANGGASGSGSRSGIDENHSARRVAALNKFRQKRKERCFEKKVRYQSRKRLAEQRPRVRGQFVRQVAQENNSNVTDS